MKEEAPVLWSLLVFWDDGQLQAAGTELEVELHAQLQNARIARRGHLVIERRDEVGRSAANWIRMIESVEGLEAELAGKALREFHVLKQRKVGAPETGPADSPGALCVLGIGGGRGGSEGRWVKKMGKKRRGLGRGVPNLI